MSFDDELLLSDIWTVYHHASSDDNWTMSSYERLGDVSSAEDCHRHCEHIGRHVEDNMVFVMRGDIAPVWDDPANLNGCIASVKVPKADVRDAFVGAFRHLVNESVLADDGDGGLVNGISCSPKLRFCVIKVWLSDRTFRDAKRLFFVADRTVRPEEVAFKDNIDNMSVDQMRRTAPAEEAVARRR